MINKSLGCWDPTGDFTISRLERDADGRITGLDAEVEHRCGGEDRPDNAFHAKIHITS